MSRIKIKKSILVCFLLTAFLVCVLCPMLAQKTYAEESQETSFFNYVDEGAIDNQDVANQNTQKLCWAFSGTKAIESFLYNKAHDKTAEDDASLWENFSESWISLAYMYYVNDSLNDDKFVTAAKKQDTQYEFKYQANDDVNYKYNNYGNAYYLQRAINTYGVLYQGNESGQCPLQLTVTWDNVDSEDYYTKVFDNYKIYADKTKVKNIEFKSIVNYCDTTYENSTDKSKELAEILARMKHYLKNYGALSTYVISGNEKMNANSEKFVFHNPLLSIEDGGHALTIIGYDDNKSFTVEGEEYKGAFKAVNSTTDEPSYLWIPYDMYTPSITKNGDNSRENNNVLSNTYFIYHLESGSNNWTANTYVSAENNSTNSPNTSFFSIVMNFFGENATIKIIAVIVGIIFIITAVILSLTALIRKRATQSVNKNVMLNSLANYQAKQVEFEKQRKELDMEIQKLRYESYRKKQRRLKRQFQKRMDKKNIDENKT